MEPWYFKTMLSVPGSSDPMQILVTIPDELAAHARARDLLVEAFAQSFVEEARLRSLSPSQPSLPTESFTRESFYRDRN
jgi:hypothetical protein